MSRQFRDFHKSFKDCFGFTPGSIDLYTLAFSHRSVGPGTNENNERLEFLGDSVISHIVSEYLFERYPELREGALTKIRTNLVNREFLNEIAITLGITHFLKFDKNLKIDPVTKSNVFGNAFEAFIGAVYLDKGYSFTRNFFLNKCLSDNEKLDYSLEMENNYKGKLIELDLKNKLELRFEVVEEIQYNTNILFVVRVYIRNKLYAVAKESKKKKAEQKAAFLAFQKLQEKKNSNYMSTII